MTVEEFLEKKQELEKLEREESKAQGMLQERLRSLQKEAGTDDVEDARKLLKRLKRDLEKQETELEQELEEWNRKWKAKLIEAS